MKILIVGAGGREHVLAETYSKNKNVEVIFVAPGNDFMTSTNPKIKTLPTIHQLALEKILTFAKREQVDLVDVAMDDPLSLGAVDLLQSNGFPTFGPTKKAAEIEWSKAWSREFMKKYHLPTPAYKIFTSPKDAMAYLKKLPDRPYFVKASGLALGKGALYGANRQEALDAVSQMKAFGDAGKEFLIEECMIGEEFSLFAICDGKTYRVLGNAQDHKRALDGDQGLNTGGMGCVSPTGVLTPGRIKEIEKTILLPFMNGMREEKRPYTGILYVGGMITQKGVQLVEFNARWGEPEAEVILTGLKNDYLELIQKAVQQSLDKTQVLSDKRIRLSIAGCARGYPTDYSPVKGKEIFGIDEARALPGISVFGAGMKKKGSHYVVSGGRVFHLIGEGATIQQARERAYAAMSHIFIQGNNLQYRSDIGWREIERIL